jgi:AcrR family transcriptional regulator
MLAGKVEERILDAAGQVFLERGFQGVSVDEIAEVACAGKPTIYARFPGSKRCSRPLSSALFAAIQTSRRSPAPAARSRSGSRLSRPSC